MKSHKLSTLFAVVVTFSMVLVACGTPAATTQAPAEATSAPAVAFTGDKLDAGSCDYGGQILSIEAVDRLTVTFNLCRNGYEELDTGTTEVYNPMTVATLPVPVAVRRINTYLFVGKANGKRKSINAIVE